MSANLYAAFLERQTPFADKVFLNWSNRLSLTYGELPAAVGRYQAALVALGCRPGDRLIVQAERSPAFIMLYLASLAAGVIFIPLNTAYTPDELAYFIGDAEPRVVVGQAATRAILEAAAAGVEGARIVTIEGDGSGTLEQMAADATPLTDVHPSAVDDVACILYTSGTTGRPKGAMLSHGNLSSNVAALTEAWQFSADDVLLHTLPLFHAHGLFVALQLCLWNGCTVLALDKFEPGAVIDALPRASVFMGVPTFYTRLLASGRLTRDACRTMRLFVSGSAPLLPQTFDEFEAATGHRILERYGMTETIMITSNPYEMSGRKAGTVGYALPGIEVRVVDGDGKVVGDGVVGDLEVRGPNVLKGYWRKPEATAQSFRPGDWFITGDVAVADADGRVTLVGRSKDLIISGGYNVYPAEVESVLNDLPGVKESAVIGVPHPDFGEGVVAVLVAEDGATLDTAAIDAAIADKLAKFKRPKLYEVRDELPRNTMGKVLKAQLRQDLAKTFTA